MPRYEFTTGQVLTADQMNDLSDQTVMTFAGTAARGSAIPTPVEGMVTYLADTDELQVYTNVWGAVAGGKILQVVSTTKTDTFSSSSTTPVDITGATVSITPAATSSKIFVVFDTSVGMSTLQSVALRLLRDSTVIGGGTAAGSRLSAISVSTVGGANYREQASGSFLDSPSSTSSITYKLQGWGEGGTWYVGRSSGDTDSASSAHARTPLTITAIEVAG